MADAVIENPIGLANSLMSIVEACNLLDMDVMEGASASYKYYCPFGDINHLDGGRSKAFRIYEHTNSAYCWACSLYFTPVRLVAEDRDLSHLAAAAWIIEQKGYVPPDYEARWDALAGAQEPEPDRDGLTSALKLACRQISPEWGSRQFDEAVATKFQQCVGLLGKVVTDQDARNWLRISKQAMQKVLTR